MTLHPQARTAKGDMRNDRCPTMNLGNTAQIDRESQLYQRPLRQPEVRGFDEDAIGAQIPRPAQLALAARHVQVNGGAGKMPRVQTAFHREDPRDRIVGA